MKLLFAIILLFLAAPAYAASPDDVVINEIAWMGTTNSHNDEWIELYNNTESEIILDGWVLKSTDDSPSISLDGNIGPFDFFLLERTDDSTVPGQTADQIYTGALKNDGEHLQLFDDGGNTIDEVNSWGSWFKGDNTTKQTMERKDPQLTGSDPVSWTTSVDPGGTPKAQNSVYQTTQPEPEPNPEPEPPAEEPEPEPEPSLPAEEEEPDPTEDPATVEADPPTDEEEAEPAEEPLEPQESEATSTPPIISSSTSTQGLATTTPSTSSGQAPTTYPASIFINELMPSPTGPDELEEWIELTNEGAEQANISSWKIQDTSGVTNAYIFPEGSTIAPNGFIVLSRPTTKITLNNDADGLNLINPDGEIAQVLLYSNAPRGSSYVRTNNTSTGSAQDSWEWSSVPTPGSANILPAPPKPKPTPKPSEPTIDDLKKVVETYKEIKESEDGSLTLTQKNEDDERAKQIASIAESAPSSKTKYIYALAIFTAAFSAVFIFLLRKRTAK